MVSGFSMAKYYMHGAVVPCLTRMGDNYVLSDFMFNDSVIRKGDRNFWHQREVTQEHALAMCDLANGLYNFMGSCSISYGFISSEVSEKRVKWRKPTSPSYHRWDDGCAADFVFHEYADHSPSSIAWYILQEMPISRLITYASLPMPSYRCDTR